MVKRIKILFTIPNFKTAGSQYVLLSLLRGIDKKKFEPFIAVERFPELIPEDIPIKNRLLLSRSGKSWRDIRNIAFLLKENDIDLVHSWDHKSEALEAFASRIARVKYIFTKKNNAWSKRWMLKSLVANHIAYDNPEMKSRFFSNTLLRHKVSFIPHGVDTGLFKPYKKKSHSSFNLCCVGNIVPNKNQLFLVKCLLSLSEKFQLHLYGRAEKSYLKKIEKYIESNHLENRVFYHGFVENKELPKVFRKNDVFVLASVNEGLPVSILEALACGLPVVASNSGGGTAYILENERGGYIFERDQKEEFIQKVRRLEENRSTYEQKKKEAVDLVEEKFDLQREIKTYENLYFSLV